MHHHSMLVRFLFFKPRVVLCTSPPLPCPTGRHSDDVAISCGAAAAAATPPLRLVNGTAQMGRLEIRFNEAYGTVSVGGLGACRGHLATEGRAGRRGGTTRKHSCLRAHGRNFIPSLHLARFLE